MGGAASKASETARRAAPRASSAFKPRSEPTPAAFVQTTGAASITPTHDVAQPQVGEKYGTNKSAAGATHPQPRGMAHLDHNLKRGPGARRRTPRQDTWRPPGAPPVSPTAANDLYSGGSSGDEDDNWPSNPAASSMLNQLAGSIRQRGSFGGTEHTGPVEVPQIRRKEMPPDLRERVSVDDLRGVFVRVQQATLSGRSFDVDAEATRMGMDSAMLRDAIRFTSLPLIRKDGQGDLTVENPKPSAKK